MSALVVALALLGAPRAAYAVEGGTPDRATSFAVAIATGGPASPSVRCSGTLVSPNVVLTARHCIAGTSAETAQCRAAFGDAVGVPADLWVSAAAKAEPSLSWKNVASWVVPTDNQPCGADLALLVLEAPFAESEAMPASIVLTKEDFRAAALARVAGLAGFGSSSSAASDSGIRRSRFDVPVHCVPGDPAFLCGSDLDLVEASELTTTDGACTGDSGAGAIAAGETNTIFGVLSRNISGSCGAGIFERTDVWRWLIAKTVLDATPLGESAPAWASASFPDAPGVGDLCRADECGAAASCVSFDGARSYVCAAHCAAGCADGSHCENDLCAPGDAPTSADAGCAITTTPHDDASWIFAIQLAALGGWYRRRRGAHGRRRSVRGVRGGAR